jgi:hypothetical protein
MIGKLLIIAGLTCAATVVGCVAVAARRSQGAGSHQRPRPSFVPSDAFYVPHAATWGNR